MGKSKSNKYQLFSLHQATSLSHGEVQEYRLQVLNFLIFNTLDVVVKAYRLNVFFSSPFPKLKEWLSLLAAVPFNFQANNIQLSLVNVTDTIGCKAYIGFSYLSSLHLINGWVTNHGWQKESIAVTTGCEEEERQSRGDLVWLCRKCGTIGLEIQQ